jgi:hypothetical protein
MRHFTLTQLRYSAVAELENRNQAVARLLVSQSAVSTATTSDRTSERYIVGYRRASMASALRRTS